LAVTEIVDGFVKETNYLGTILSYS
jgi:hypothetical protein